MPGRGLRALGLGLALLCAQAVLPALHPLRAIAADGRFGVVRAVTLKYSVIDDGKGETPWSGVHLRLSRVGGTSSDTATTDVRGHATFPRVRAGRYVLSGRGGGLRADGSPQQFEERSRRPFRVFAGRAVAETLRIVAIPDPKRAMYR